MKKNLILLGLFFLSLLSAQNNKDYVVLKARDANIPWDGSYHKSFAEKNMNELKKSPTDHRYLNYPSTSNRNLLGHSIKNDIYPYEDTRNLGYRVVDIEKLSKKHPSYLNAWKIGTGETNYFVYDVFDKYAPNSTVSKKITNGAGINLGLFSIGNKNTFTKTFTKTYVEEKNNVFGELNILVRDSSYRMQTSTNILSEIKTDYLHEDFKDELYNTHTSEFFSNYGGFVLSAFITGGKATALYSGIYKKQETNTTKEKNLGTEISSSFSIGLKENSSLGVTGNINLGRDNKKGISVTNEFSSIKMTIKTIGGNSSFGGFSLPKEIKNTQIDLSSWTNSLSDKNTHSIIDFGESGLIPITEFIPELDLRIKIYNYYRDGVEQIDKLQEPYINITKTPDQEHSNWYLTTELHTKFGSRILLSNYLLPENTIETQRQRELERYSKVFGLEIRDAGVSPMDTNINYSMNDVYFDEPALKKYIHNGVIYLVNTNKKVKLDLSEYSYTDWHLYNAFAIHSDRALDQYGIRDLVNRLPTINMDYETFLQRYIICAL